MEQMKYHFNSHPEQGATPMTHSYEDIIRLDSERTQGDWEFHDGGRNNDWSESSWVQIPEHFDDNGNDSDDVIYLRLTTNAQYIAAMPDAVGLLKRYRGFLEWIANMPDEDNEWHGRDMFRDIRDAIKQLLQEEQKG